MQKSFTHSKSSLFLMEMTLSILILALTCTACVKIFVAARVQRQEARNLNHIQELTVSAGEALEGWDGNLSAFSQIFGESCKSSQTDSTSRTDILNYYYDNEWKSCQKENAAYTMSIELKTSLTVKTADINFYNSRAENLYQISISFPFRHKKGESS